MTGPAPLFTIDELAGFDGEALRTFLEPGDGGIDPRDLAHALRAGDAPLLQRVRAALPEPDRAAFAAALDNGASGAAIAASQRRVMEKLFWPLVYWNRPDEYAALIRGERIHQRILDELDLDGRIVCDIGAGCGRFALAAAKTAARVIAVDVIPALLERLREQAKHEGIRNIDIRRGRFSALPLDDASIDCAVACSAFTSTGPHGGERALTEAERIVRPGGQVAIIWPQDARWYTARGYTYIRVEGSGAVEFQDSEEAESLCRRYYSEAAARWVHDTGNTCVPYSVLGVPPPNDVCLKRIE
ncbi:MAG: methyltransferase domain-containing protein [Candidatus Dormibacteraeota bacterium]|nr:methyltransferase domain-containing protein [Candidatus Dormibacteraeota bacterium]